MNENRKTQAMIASCRELINQAENTLMMFIEKKLDELGTIDFQDQDTLLIAEPKQTITGLAKINDDYHIVTYCDGDTKNHELTTVNVHDLLYCADQIEKMYFLG